MIEIDGSMGEGGGQVLRSSLALSLLTGQAFHLRNVRAKRKPKPGLRPQHLAGVRAAATIGNARTSGASLGSTDLTFEPGEVVPGEYRFAIGTAGATSLLLHAIYLPLALRSNGAASRLVLEGGTHVPTSPCYHFLEATWRSYLARMGLAIDLRMPRPGFYPRGGGTVEVHILPCEKLTGLRLESAGDRTRARGFSAAASLPEHVARRQAQRLTERLGRQDIAAEIELEAWPNGPGSVVAVCFEGAAVPTLFFGIGERGKPAERVADEAAEEAVAFARSDAAVDAHSADQILLPLALAEGESVYRVTSVTRHLTTNIAVIRRFIEREITCEGAEGKPGVVRIAGGGSV